MSMNILNKIQFTLKIEKMQDTANMEQDGFARSYPREEKDPKWEAYETLDFNGLSGVEVIRKVLDYINY